MNNSMMQFEGVAAIFAVVAILCLLAGYKLLANSSWVAGWLRGNIGILCVLLTGFFALCVLDVRSYKPMFDDKTVATISFRQTSPQHYEARIVDAAGVESRYTVAGDSWYLSANQFKWSKRLSLGMGHGYRFNTINGLYQQTAGAKNRDVISRSQYFDVWKYMNSYPLDDFIVSTAIIDTAPEPLADAAMYEVVPSGFDLIVKPMNDFAKRAQLAVMAESSPSGAETKTGTAPEAPTTESTTSNAILPVSAISDGTKATSK